jgi:hypothetical protein
MDLAEAKEREFHDGISNPCAMARAAVVSRLIRRHVPL